MEDKNIELIRNLLIEKIDFDELDKIFQVHRNDKNFYVKASPYFILIEKIKIEDEDDCQKYKIRLLSIKIDLEPEITLIRNPSFYSDNMRETFLLDDKQIKSYNLELDKNLCDPNSIFKIPEMEYMIHCELILNHDKSIYSYNAHASVIMVDTLSPYQETVKTIDEPNLATLYDWLSEKFEFSEIEFKGVINRNGRYEYTADKRSGY